MGLTPKDKLAAAVLRVVGVGDNTNAVAPYFGAVLRGLIRREYDSQTEEILTATGRTPTLAVSANGILWWSAKFVESVDVTELALCLVHESMHIVLKTFERGEAQGIPFKGPVQDEEHYTRAQLFNIAADACINEEIRKIPGSQLPGYCVFPDTLKQPEGLVAEERYRLLLQQQPQKRGKGRAGAGECGGCAHNPGPNEQKPKQEGAGNEGRSEAEIERWRKQVAEEVKSAAEKGRGTVPDSLQRWASAYLSPPKVDWRTKLARVIRGAVSYKSGAQDFTWGRMSRRQGGLGFGVGRAVLPSLHAPIPRVAVVVDTSGSMSEVELAEAMSELRGILSTVGAEVTVVTCDAAVHGIQPCRNVDEAVKLLKGGGGTAMAPALEALTDLKERPSIVIVCTDGYIDQPAEPPFRVIWCVLGGNEGFSMPYGDVVLVERAGAKTRT